MNCDENGQLDAVAVVADAGGVVAAAAAAVMLSVSWTMS